MYSVRDELAKDPQRTVRAVAAMGYQGLEFYAPYLDWTPTQAKEMKALMDSLGIRCFSTHNSESYFRSNTSKKQSTTTMSSEAGTWSWPVRNRDQASTAGKRSPTN